MSRLEGHQARKQFGQNCLVDERIIHDILSVIDARPDEHVVEIGAGLGALTAGLLGGGSTVTAIEIDRDLIPRLTDKFGHDPRFRLIAQDALTVDLHALRVDAAAAGAEQEHGGVGDLLGGDGLLAVGELLGKEVVLQIARDAR